MLPPSESRYAPCCLLGLETKMGQAYRRTDGRTLDRYVTLCGLGQFKFSGSGRAVFYAGPRFALDAASVNNSIR